MTGVELIVAALAAATTAGATSGAQDAYAGLKHLLVKRLAGRSEAVEALQAREAEPTVWHSRIGEDLVSCGAASDEQILAAARAVLAQASPDKHQPVNYISTNYGVSAHTINAPVTIYPPATPGTA